MVACGSSTGNPSPGLEGTLVHAADSTSADQWVQHGDKLTLDTADYPKLLALLEEFPFPRRDTPAISGRGVRLGLTEKAWPEVFFGPWRKLALHLNYMLAKALDQAGREAVWFSIQVNEDCISAPHTDNSMPGNVALIMLAGSFSYGALHCSGLTLKFGLHLMVLETVET